MTPEEVFTPRSPDVNRKTYVNRPSLEGALSVALRTGLHLVICGQSGSGKTWLYRYSLPKLGVYFEVVNLALVSVTSFQQAFQHIEGRIEPTKKTRYKEKKQLRGNVGFAHGQVETESTFEAVGQCCFYRCLERVHSKSRKKGRRCLVFDNLESIVGNPLRMKELADYLILLDDPDYAKFDVQIILVGVPAGVREYFRNVANMESVANRIRELPEVARLSSLQVEELVKKGFQELKIDLATGESSRILSHVFFVTDGLPQRIHEYCFELAEISMSSRVISVRDLSVADRRWLRSSLIQAYEIVVGSMNKRNKEKGKRNQVLFVLGQIEFDEFEARDVNDAVMGAFYGDALGKLSFNASSVLRDLATQPNPILVRSQQGNTFRFADPRYRMAIRVCLRKEPPLGVIALESEMV